MKGVTGGRPGRQRGLQKTREPEETWGARESRNICDIKQSGDSEERKSGGTREPGESEEKFEETWGAMSREIRASGD